MQDIKYHSSQVLNKKETYSDFDNIDFQISPGVGRKLVGGSVRLLGNITVGSTASPNSLSETISYDGLTGSHSWFNSIVTSFSAVGQVENLNFYPHMVASKARAQLSKEDCFQSQYICENRCPDGRLSNIMLKGLTYTDGETFDAAKTKQLDFAIKPDFCLNNFVPGSDNTLPYVKSGDINISMVVARSVSVLYGTATSGAGAIGVDRNITLSNLRLTYTSISDDGKYPKQYQMIVRSSLKQSIQSSYASISSLVPLVSDRFFMVFVPQAQDNDARYNGLACVRPPNISRLEFLWSDSFSAEYTYALVNEEEILTGFVRAVNNTVSDNQTALQMLAANDGFGAGLSYGTFIDLSKNKISINLTSGVTSSAPMSVYMFFQGVISI
jgi:hypothetical protein